MYNVKTRPKNGISWYFKNFEKSMSQLNDLKNDGQSLSQLFKKGWKEFGEIEESNEPSNSETYQVFRVIVFSQQYL